MALKTDNLHTLNNTSGSAMIEYLISNPTCASIFAIDFSQISVETNRLAYECTRDQLCKIYAKFPLYAQGVAAGS